ncbi:MAG TPA: response regulator [Terriglobia bacterium]|nr:response regulator [Terriglobia bacterium]
MKTVLVVDDEASMRKSIVVALNAKGYKTIEAEDGMEGLSLAAAEQPDVVISDVNMDNMNGFMMVEQLRDNPDTALIPVIMMTSAAQGAGAWEADTDVEYLEKGFSMQKLVETIEKVLSK